MNLTTPAIRELLSLSEQRDKIQADLEKVTDEIQKTLKHGDSGPIVIVGPPGKPVANKVSGKRGKKGTTKDLVLEALKSIGNAGISLPELAKQTGLNPKSLSVWFYTAGKKIAEIQKAGYGLYKWVAAEDKPVAAEKPIKAGKKKAKKAVKPVKAEVEPTFDGQGPPAKSANLAKPKAAKSTKAKKKAKKDKQPF